MEALLQLKERRLELEEEVLMTGLLQLRTEFDFEFEGDKFRVLIGFLFPERKQREAVMVDILTDYCPNFFDEQLLRYMLHIF